MHANKKRCFAATHHKLPKSREAFVRCFGLAGLHGQCTQSSWAAREPLQFNNMEKMLTDTQSVGVGLHLTCGGAVA